MRSSLRYRWFYVGDMIGRCSNPVGRDLNGWIRASATQARVGRDKSDDWLASV